MDQEERQVTFYFGTFGKILPLLAAAAMIIWGFLLSKSMGMCYIYSS